MTDKTTMDEGFDLRRFLLLGGRRAWVILPAALIGALLFSAFRFIKQEVYAPEPLYRNDTLYMIEFTEGLQEETQLYFNDYTWNEVIDSDRIAGVAVGMVEGVDRAALNAATTVPTMSDIRFFHVYVDYTDPQTADLIQNALEVTLGSFSFNARGFDSISVYTRGKAQRLFTPGTIHRWCIAGAIIGALVGCFVLAWLYILDDRIRLVRDVERAGGKCAGVIFMGQHDEEEESRLRAALAAELKGAKELRIVDPAGTAITAAAAAAIRSFLPEDITEGSSAEAKHLYCVSAGSISMAELSRQLGDRKETVVLCDADRKLHKAYYFYGMKKDKAEKAPEETSKKASKKASDKTEEKA
ncbi:MAG: hypothetical protein IK115_09785 [Lachnospiraceae bacterium]|nr:hypothetical protein [Lachnospiraceae bacterium]